ncbi:MAG TPA: DUF4388 domain-containing protein [Thermoanaerobaculia bacterium]|nr:DUF4388 domain-containing protein [Thermoanaerobaculia bacterium]
MSEDLSIQGSLSETTVPDLCRSLLRSSETAILTLQAEGRHDSIYFREGRIVFASTSDADTGVAEVLLMSGELNLQQYNDAIDNSSGSKRMGAVLCELGYLRPEHLMRAVERQVTNIVMQSLTYRSGDYTIEFTSGFAGDILELSLSSERLLMDGVGRIENWSLIARGIGKMGRLLRQAEGADARMYQFDVSEEESHIYSLMGTAQKVESLCELSYLSNFSTCRTIWSLLAGNLIEEAEIQEISETRAAERGEFELVSDVELYNTVFQKIFNLVFQRIGDHTYDFIDRVVIHLSPETLPYLSGMSLVNEGRVDFDQLLNNLIASGSTDKRAVIISVLNELLYGWLFEIRSEFGTSLERETSEIMAIIRKA